MHMCRVCCVEICKGMGIGSIPWPLVPIMPCVLVRMTPPTLPWATRVSVACRVSEGSVSSRTCCVYVWFVCWWAVEELKERALERYTSVKGAESEQLVSGSDDFTLFLWKPGESRKPVARMTGEEGGGVSCLVFNVANVQATSN